MALVKCEKCGAEISSSAKTCVHCGAPVIKKIKCPECGAMVEEGTKICPKCGKELFDIKGIQSASIHSLDGLKNGCMKVIHWIMKHIAIIIVAACLIVAGTVVYNLFFTPYAKFTKLIKEAKYEDAIDVYDDFESYKDRTKAKKVFEKEVNNTLKEYVDDQIIFDDAISRLELLDSIYVLGDKAEKMQNTLEEIKNSKECFEKATKYAEAEDLVNAIVEYKKVIEDDKNDYKVAQAYIKSNFSQLKNNVLVMAEKFIETNDLVSARNALQAAIDAGVKDVKVEEKLKEIKDEADIQEEQNLISKQELLVTSTGLETSSYGGYVWGVKANVYNSTQKVVKNFRISFLGWDKNGYPVQLGYKEYNSEGTGNGVNMQPGETYGNGHYWSVDNEDDIKTVKAVVVSAEYYDDTTWDNPYYEYWLNKYSGKQLGE